MLVRRFQSARAAARPRLRNFESLESRVLFAEVAGTLLVDVDARNLAVGEATAVPNAGTLGGVFAPTGDATTVPVIGRPTANATSGTHGIRFDGTDFLQLVSAPGGSLITAPAEITGLDPATSIETWVWNQGIPGEETQVAWGARGGPDGTNMSFNYGNNGDWGAVGHWGPSDIGWGPTVPAAARWHHLVYTFGEDNVTRIYVDGVLANTETLAEGALNIWPDTAINLATQLEGDQVTPTGGLRGSLTLGKVRIHTGTLTPEQVALNYNAEKAQFVEPGIPPREIKPAEILVNVDATTLPEGEALTVPNTGPLGGVFEATGGDPGTVPVIGRPAPGATIGTVGIRMDGTDFMQLVNGAGGELITAPADITGAEPQSSIETWVWNPSIPGEETMVAWGKRGGPDGSNYSFNYGNDNRWGAMGHWGAPDMGWLPGTVDNAPAAGRWHHLVYTFDGEIQRVYVDGAMTNSENLGIGGLNIHGGTAINLGTQLEPDGVTPTAALRGSLTLGKVRIYEGVLTDAQIAANHTSERPAFVEPQFPQGPPAVLLVSVDATTLPEGPANNIVNTGPLGGVFEATGGEGTVPVIDQPLTGATSGTVGIRMDGTDFLQLVTAPGGSLITAPESITGQDPPASVETWVWNPSIANEETQVAWGYRGGPDGTNMSFLYGYNNDWGAVGRWGASDIGWGPNVPASGQWHHLVSTFDGAVSRIYVDGALVNTEAVGFGVVNTHPDTAINIGTQLEPDGVTPTPGLRGSLTLGKVRIYEGTLTDAQIAANYNNERAQFVNPVIAPAALAVRPIHRYSFNEAAGDASGDAVVDSIGGANGSVLGAGATWNGSRLILPGGPSASAAYVDLPNGILSDLGAANGGSGQVTLEGWFRHTGSQSWSRFYDFGSSTAGEVAGPGGAGNGVDFVMLTAQTGGDTRIHRVEVTDNDDGDPTGNTFVDNFSTTFNTDLHFVFTWNETTGEVKYYENGVEMTSFNSPILIDMIDDVNNWLGRSNYLADANLQAELDEFRIYDRALTPAEIVGNLQAGANTVTGGPNVAAISQVFVNGAGLTGQTSANGVAFRNLAGIDNTYGYPVPAGANQTRSIPWNGGINQVSLRFAADPTGLEQGDLVIRGVNTPVYAVSGYSYDAATKTGTWTLATPITNDKIRLFLDDALVANLDGEWQDATAAESYPSGNGVVGGDFSFRFNVLRGDATQDGVVNALDLSFIKQRLNKTATNPGSTGAVYSVFADLTSDGSINALDLSAAKQRLNNRLPTADPASALLFSSRPISA